MPPKWNGCCSSRAALRALTTAGMQAVPHVSTVSAADRLSRRANVMHRTIDRCSMSVPTARLTQGQSAEWTIENRAVAMPSADHPIDRSAAATAAFCISEYLIVSVDPGRSPSLMCYSGTLRHPRCPVVRTVRSGARPWGLPGQHHWAPRWASVTGTVQGANDNQRIGHVISTSKVLVCNN